MKKYWEISKFAHQEGNELVMVNLEKIINETKGILERPLQIAFDLYDGENKEVIQSKLDKTEVKGNDLINIIRHINNEYMDTYNEVIEFREKTGTQWDKYSKLFVPVEKERK